MKKFIQYLRGRPLGLAAAAVLIFLYTVMIFADFFAPYTATASFEGMTYHPPNVRLAGGGIRTQEARVMNTVTWKYVRVKGLFHKISFFVKGGEYRLLGFIPCSVHLFGTKDSSYPAFLFGADNLGRDLFSRLVHGSRISLTIGFIATAISLLLAVVFGGFAGYFGGIADWSIMRFSEFFMLIPGLYLILFLRSLLSSAMDSGKSYMIITVILSLVGWPSSARTIRGLVHSIKREEFVLNAQLEGIPPLAVIFSHIIPQMASLLIVSTALGIPGYIMSETTLSYLGLGIVDPAVSWGSLIKRDISTLSNLRNYPWLLSPVWLLLSVTLAFNFFGDVLRDYFDPYHIVLPHLRPFEFFRRKKEASHG
jgi:peptide/nickel transport system permease protein